MLLGSITSSGLLYVPYDVYQAVKKLGKINEPLLRRKKKRNIYQLQTSINDTHEGMGALQDFITNTSMKNL